VYVLQDSHAASPYVTNVAINGTLGEAATPQASTNTVGTNAVQFGSQSSGTTAKLLLGEYDDPQGDWQSVTSFGQETGTTQSIATAYVANSSWSAYMGDLNYLLGLESGMPYRQEIGIPLVPNGDSFSALNGNLSVFTNVATALVNAGYGNAIIRLSWEFNIGTTNQCQPDPSGFVSDWQQVVTTMRAVPGQHFLFEWNSVPGTYYNIEANCYPGNNYVDLISSDPYDQSYATPLPNNTPSESATVWNTIVNDPYDGLNALAAFAAQNNKQLSFAEWGVGDKSGGYGLGDDPNYINSLAAWVKTHNVYYISYFNDYPSGWDTILSDSPNSLAAFKTDFAGY
jgi:hypothetical protein